MNTDTKHGKYKTGTKLWLDTIRGTVRVEVTNNRVQIGNCYHGYTVRYWSDRFNRYTTVGAVSESSLRYRKRAA